MDFTAMTGYDTATIIAAFAAIGATLAAVRFGRAGVRWVLGLIR